MKRLAAILAGVLGIIATAHGQDAGALAAVLMGQSAAVPANPNLVGWWKLDGNGTDYSQYGNNMTLYNSPTSAMDRASVPGKALSFNGSNQYGMNTSASALNITNAPITLTAWIYPRNTSGWFILCRNGASFAETQYGFLYQNNQILFSLNGAHRAAYTGMTISERWTHIAFVWAADGAIMGYTNGVPLVGSWAYAATLTTRPNTAIATRSNVADGSTASGYLNALLDDVRIYRQALTDEEVVTVMNGGTP